MIVTLPSACFRPSARFRGSICALFDNRQGLTMHVGPSALLLRPSLGPVEGLHCLSFGPIRAEIIPAYINQLPAYLQRSQGGGQGQKGPRTGPRTGTAPEGKPVRLRWIESALCSAWPQTHAVELARSDRALMQQTGL